MDQPIAAELAQPFRINTVSRRPRAEGIFYGSVDGLVDLVRAVNRIPEAPASTIEN
jgi:hypothetical protein